MVGRIKSMCLGIPGQVISLKGQKAKLKQPGHFHWVDVSALDQKVKVGDFLLCYQDTAINKVDSRQAEEILSLIEND